MMQRRRAFDWLFSMDRSCLIVAGSGSTLVLLVDYYISIALLSAALIVRCIIREEQTVPGTRDVIEAIVIQRAPRPGTSNLFGPQPDHGSHRRRRLRDRA